MSTAVDGIPAPEDERIISAINSCTAIIVNHQMVKELVVPLTEARKQLWKALDYYKKEEGG